MKIKIVHTLLWLLGLFLPMGLGYAITTDTTELFKVLQSDTAKKKKPVEWAISIYHDFSDTATLRKIILKIDDWGFQSRNLGNYREALYFHQLALSLSYLGNLLDLQARCYNNIGVVFRRMDNYEPALQNHLQALRMAELSGSTRSIGIALNSIGNINFMIGKYDLALKYFLKGYLLEKKHQSLRGMSINLNNIGNVYLVKGDTSIALNLFHKSLKLNQKINDIKGIGICYNDIGNVYLAQRETKKAIEAFRMAQKYMLLTNDKRYISITSRNLGKALIASGQIKQALEQLLYSYHLAQSIEAKWEEENSARALAMGYSALGDFKNAYYYANLAHQLRDINDREKASKNVSNLQAVFNLEKVEKEKEFYRSLNELAQQKLKKEKVIRYLVIAGIIITIIIFLLILKYRKQYINVLKQKNDELARAREELSKYSAELENALKKSEASARAKNIFLANISHDFRTPLNAIIGFATLAKLKPSGEKEALLDIVIKSANQLLELVSDLLNISSMEAGQLSLRQQRVDLRNLLKETRHIFLLEAQSKSLDFFLEISDNLPRYILSDEGRLRQLIYNILGNSIKFTDSGRVEVKAWVEPEKEKIRYTLRIQISDTGPGIPEEEQKLIFEPFYLGKNSQISSTGMGLGLSIANRIVQMMSGHIELISAVGEGSTFTIVIPNVQEVFVYHEPVEPTQEQTNHFPTKIKALVADDVEANWKLIGMILKEFNTDVIYASNGKEAIEKAITFKPDVIFLDIRMPVMNGVECAQHLREFPELKNSMIIAVTASVFGDELDQLKQWPFDSYLLKPIDLEEFRRIIINLSQLKKNYGKNLD